MNKGAMEISNGMRRPMRLPKGEALVGRASNNGGRGRYGSSRRGSRLRNMKCYNYGKLGHPKYKCPEKASKSSHGEKKINYIQEENNSRASEVDLDVATYTEEFQKLEPRSRVQEVESIKVVRYLNSLKCSIQDEMSLFSLTTL